MFFEFGLKRPSRLPVKASLVNGDMIRKVVTKNKIRIPASLRSEAKRGSGRSFWQFFIDTPIRSVSKIIPFPIERQVHSLVVLGDGWVQEHVDHLPDFNKTAYCIPIHLPRGATFHQYDQVRLLEEGSCYSFNHNEMHGVSVPEGCKTYSAFLIVDISRIDATAAFPNEEY